MKTNIVIIIGIVAIISFLSGSLITANGYMNTFLGTGSSGGASSEIEMLKSQYAQLEQKISELETSSEADRTQIAALESSLAETEASLGLTLKPDYDSGWIDAPNPGDLAAVKLAHNLGTIDYVVYIWGAEWDGSIWHYHQNYLGTWDGLLWSAHENDVLLWRGKNDSDWLRMRVLIWRLPETSDIL